MKALIMKPSFPSELKIRRRIVKAAGAAPAPPFDYGCKMEREELNQKNAVNFMQLKDFPEDHDSTRR
jgi:hypothetical protein